MKKRWVSILLMMAMILGMCNFASADDTQSIVIVNLVDEVSPDVVTPALPDVTPFPDIPSDDMTFTAADRAITAQGTCGENLTWILYSDGELAISGTGSMEDWSSQTNVPWYEYTQDIKKVTINKGAGNVGNYAFNLCENLESVEMSEGVTRIGRCAFALCSSLTSVSLPDGLTSIGDNAFRFCIAIPNIQIPSSVTNIEEYAFFNCAKLGSVVLPSGLTTISEYSFSGCESFTSVVLPNSVKSINQDAFSDCKNLVTLSIPDNVTYIGDMAFWNCERLINVTIGSGLTSMGSSPFLGCFRIKAFQVDRNNPAYSSDENGVLFNKDKTVLIYYPAGSDPRQYTVPESVTAIGNSAFRNSDLVDIEIPDSVTSIGYTAFYYCISLKNIKMSKNVSFIGSNAFRECRMLESISIPDGVTTIDSNTFFYCLKLNTIEIGSGMTNIADNAFAACSVLKDVYYNGTETEWNAITIGTNNGNLLNATIHFLGDEKFTVTFMDGETEYAIISDVAKDSVVSLPTPPTAPEGKTFVGWFDDDDNAFLDTTPVTKNMTVRAKWSIQTFSVTFMDEGLVFVQLTDIPYNTTVTLPTPPAKSGYRFVGWYVADKGWYEELFSEFTETTLVTRDMTVAAQWEANTYTVTFDANGGSGAPDAQVKTHGTDLTLSTVTPTRVGYTFLGWSVVRDANMIAYKPGGTYSENEDITLYAVWMSGMDEENFVFLGSDLVLYVGSSFTMRFTATPTDLNNIPFSIRNSNPSVVSVEKTAVPNVVNQKLLMNCTVTVTAVAEGNTAVSILYGDKSITCNVTVKPLPDGTEDPTPDEPSDDPNTSDGCISVGSARGKAGDTISIDISLKNNPGIVAARAKVIFDTDILTLTEVRDGGILGTQVHSDVLSSPYTLYWNNGTANENFTANGTAATLVFKIKENAPAGHYPITVSAEAEDILNTDMEEVPFTTENGEAEVIRFIPGDVNGDGEVTAKDNILLARYLAGWKGYDADTIDLEAADVNGDGKVNVKDNMILSRHIAAWKGYEVLPLK